MIYERRAYLLRHGEEDTFWNAQKKWNSGSTFQPILRSNLFYMVSPGARGTEVLHFYRHGDLNEWRSAYERYFAAQDGEFFATVRGLMVSQQTDFFIESPFTQRGDVEEPGTFGDNPIVVETMVDTLPGQLPKYWQNRPEDQRPVIAVQSLTGTLHRALEYRIFAAEAAAEEFAESFKGIAGSPGIRQHQVRIGKQPPLSGRFSFFDGSRANTEEILREKVSI